MEDLDPGEPGGSGASMPCIGTSFVGEGEFLRSGSMKQRGPAHEESNLCLSARRYLDRRCAW